MTHLMFLPIGTTFRHIPQNLARFGWPDHRYTVLADPLPGTRIDTVPVVACVTADGHLTKLPGDTMVMNLYPIP